MAKPKPDTTLQTKWSQPRVIYSDTNPYPDPGIDFSNDPGKTDASQAQDCDVNFILKRYQQTGVLPGTDIQSLYQDVSDAPTYHEALNTVIMAQNQFDALDAYTRKRFSNDPAEFLEFASDPKNGEELIKLGLATLRASSSASTPLGEAPATPAGQAVKQ